jgi:ribosomal small subunit protein bTHX
MGKGDRRSRKGKIYRGSYGNVRRQTAAKVVVQKVAAGKSRK